MNDNEMFELLRGTDPLNLSTPITPVRGARALALMEEVMATRPKSSPSDRTPVEATSTATTILAPRSRRRWYSTAAAGVAAAAVAVAVVTPGAGTGTALAWTPSPRIATDVDADVARQTCALPDWTGSGPSETGARGDVAPAPGVLGPLAALDLRGEGGLAVFVDDVNVVMCMLTVVDGTPQFAGGMSTARSAEASNTLTVEGAMTTGIDSNRAVSMLAGLAGPAALVEIRVAELRTITATLVDGRFAAWWPEPELGSGTSLDTPITIVSYAADGSEIANIVWTAARNTTDTSRSPTDTSRNPTP